MNKDKEVSKKFTRGSICQHLSGSLSSEELKLLLGRKELGIIIHKILTAMSELGIIYFGQNFKPKLIQNNKGSG
jgi:hypothetical protein